MQSGMTRRRIAFSATHSSAATGSLTTYRPPECRRPWKRPLVPSARSARSTRIASNPRSAASQTTPAPVAPPPITSTSAWRLVTPWILRVERARPDEVRAPDVVAAVDVAHRARPRAHRQRLREDAARPVTDAGEQLAAGDARGGEEAVLAGDQVVGREHPVEVVAGVERRLALPVVARVEPPVDRAVQALQGARGDDALRRAADPHEHVDRRVLVGRH